MKLCKTCAYLHISASTYDISKCYHPSALINADPVFGYKVYWSAAAMRKSTEQHTCGALAQYHEEISTGAKRQ